MLSKTQSQRGGETRVKGKVARRDPKSHQPLSNDECCNTNVLSNDECCNTNVQFKVLEKKLISKNIKPTDKIWNQLIDFIHKANEDDLKWLDNLIQDLESKYDGNVETNPQKLSSVSEDVDEETNITRKMLKLELINNHGKRVIPPIELTQTHKISYEFIASLIKYDEDFSHLRGLNQSYINTYVWKCREENCLENIKIQLEKMDKKILNYSKRGNYSLKKERKTAQVYREFEDLRLMLEKFNMHVLEMQMSLPKSH